MTNDFIDEFSDALEKEKRGFVIMVHHGAHQAVGGCHIRTNLDDWPEYGGRTKEHDTMLALAAAYDGDGQTFTILTEEQRQTVLGALDSLGTVLAGYGHTWTAGERAIYELAVEAVTKQEIP